MFADAMLRDAMRQKRSSQRAAPAHFPAGALVVYSCNGLRRCDVPVLTLGGARPKPKPPAAAILARGQFSQTLMFMLQ